MDVQARRSHVRRITRQRAGSIFNTNCRIDERSWDLDWRNNSCRSPKCGQRTRPQPMKDEKHTRTCLAGLTPGSWNSRRWNCVMEYEFINITGQTHIKQNQTVNEQWSVLLKSSCTGGSAKRWPRCLNCMTPSSNRTVRIRVTSSRTTALIHVVRVS